MHFLIFEGSNTEITEKLEEVLMIWIKQIRQVLVESEQMRREADDIGPSAELEHWKSRMSLFNRLRKKLYFLFFIINKCKLWFQERFKCVSFFKAF